MRPSRVKTKLKRDEPALVTCAHLTDPSIHELIGLMGFDGIWMDMEHHGYSVETAGHAMRAARVGGSDIMARPAKGEYMRMGRMLEAGAHGILYPRCQSADEAREVVRWAKFAPLGERGFDGGNPDMPYCCGNMAEYVNFANEQTWIAAQIEDLKSVEQAERIAAVEGIDILFFGPGDFSVLSGIPGDFNHPKVQKAIDAVAKAAANTGKNWGTPSPATERTQELLDMGARFIASGCDLIFIKSGLEALQKNLAPLGFSFDNQFAATNADSYQVKV